MTLPRYLGLTWDHPRGKNVLLAAAASAPARHGLEIAWTAQPLEGFESTPLEDICERFDLVVLDHPHVGEAVRKGVLRPLDELFAPEWLAEVAAHTIGPCFESYRYDGQMWALPLDAASQVTATRPDLLNDPAPETWDGVESLAARTGKVALSLAGPHALLSLLSIAAALEDRAGARDPDLLFTDEVGRAAVEQMARLLAHAPAHALTMNPIVLLHHMGTADDISLCPLVYGYVNYAIATPGRRALRFLDAPRRAAGGRPGSTLGGAGLGISKRCTVGAPLREHLRWLLSAPVQHEFIPAHDGQPSRRSAWLDPDLNARFGNFYRGTAATLEQAYLRPRHAGYIAFQAEASALLRGALLEHRPPVAVADLVNERYRRHRREATVAEEGAHA